MKRVKKYLKPQSPYADIKLKEENMLKKFKNKLNIQLFVLEQFQVYQKE